MNKQSVLLLSVAAVLLAGCSTPAASGPTESPTTSLIASASTTPAPSESRAAAAPTTPAPTPPVPAPIAPAPADPPPTAAPAPLPPSAPAYPDLVPEPELNAVSVERVAGTSWNVVGDGCPPGTELHILFGIYQTDTDLLGAPPVFADANGHYSFRVHLSADFTPGTYGFMITHAPFDEELKRHATVEVVAP